MSISQPKGAARPPVLRWLTVPVVALAVACSGRSANTAGGSSSGSTNSGDAGAANISGGGSGSADTSGGPTGGSSDSASTSGDAGASGSVNAGSGGNLNFAGGGTNSTIGSSGSAGAMATDSKCGALPLPLADGLPEPSVAFDASATLKEIVISGPASTYSTGAPTGQLTYLSTSLQDQGVYSDGSVRHLESKAGDNQSQVVWTSSDATVAGVASGRTLSAGGVQGFRPGTVTITATLGAVSKSVCFVVTPPVVAQLSIGGPRSTSSVSLPIAAKQGDTVPLTCTESLTDGTKMDVTEAVAWASSDVTIATISDTGAVHGLAAGTTTVTAKLPASVPVASSAGAMAAATFDVFGSTGLQQGASCEASPEACAAGLVCCATGRLSTSSSCTPPISPQYPCPLYP